jgi:alpha-glucosidase
MPTISNFFADYQAPSWVQDAVFYQIFPDRFADGDPANNVRSGEYLCYGRPVIARLPGEKHLAIMAKLAG